MAKKPANKNVRGKTRALMKRTGLSYFEAKKIALEEGLYLPSLRHSKDLVQGRMLRHLDRSIKETEPFGGILVT